MSTKLLFIFITFSSSLLLLIFLFLFPIKTQNPISILTPQTTPKNLYNVTFAYLISASSGDTTKLKRLVEAIYHPGNAYLIHIDAGAKKEEHEEVERYVGGNSVFAKVGNVWIVKKANLVTYRGPSMLATTLHGIAMLLRVSNWDWFINLSASDYPLVTQDDLIHVFSNLPKRLNFVQHTSHLGWKMNKRGKPIIIDPALYSINKSEIWWVMKQRPFPSSFKLYTGSAWTILSRSFCEYTILGWENLPRTLLLYFTNFISSPEFYFHTLLCNSPEFKSTIINSDLRYITWDDPPGQHPRTLSAKDYRKMVLCNLAFARKFKNNDTILNKIDRELLRRGGRGFSFGGWCESESGGDCLKFQRDRYGVVRTGAGARRLRVLMNRLLMGSKNKCN